MSLYGFSWVIEGELAAMAMPDCTVGDLAELRRRGIGAVVNLSRQGWPDRVVEEGGLPYKHLPVLDFSRPHPEQVEEFVTFCDENIAQGAAVAVHCVAGKGRTGTMVACYFVHRGTAPQEAIDEIRRQRPGSIETVSQEWAVHEFADRLKRGGRS